MNAKLWRAIVRCLQVIRLDGRACCLICVGLVLLLTGCKESAREADSKAAAQQSHTSEAATPAVGDAPHKPDPDLLKRRTCWQLGWLLGRFLSATVQGADFNSVQPLLTDAGKHAKLLDLELPDIPASGRPRNEIIGPVARFYIVNPQTKEEGEGRVLQESIRRKHGNACASAFGLAFKMTFFLFFYPHDQSSLGKFRPTFDSLVGEMENAGRTAEIPTNLWESVPALIRKQKPFRDVATAVMESQARIAWHFDDLIEPPSPPARLAGISDASYGSIYLQQDDLPQGAKRTESYPSTEPSQLDPRERMYLTLAGKRRGLNVWHDNNPQHAIARIVDIRWVFPDEISAERFVASSLPFLAEDLPPVAQAPRIGATSHVLGGKPSRLLQAMLGDEAENLKQYLVIVRQRNVVVKLFCSQAKQAKNKPLRFEDVQPLAERIVQRIDQATEPVSRQKP
jgi:hypothetical protein